MLNSRTAAVHFYNGTVVEVARVSGKIPYNGNWILFVEVLPARFYYYYTP